MKNLLRLFSLSMLCLPVGLMGQSVVGDWQMTASDPDGNQMTIQVSMTANGTYTVDFGVDGSIEVNGNYKLEGSKMTIKDSSGPQACPQEAVYTVEVSGNSLKMIRVSDPCEGRGGPEGVMAFTKA